MNALPRSLEEIAKNITKPWSPVVIVRANGQIVNIALFRGSYHWHRHPNGDEMFYVYKGEITIRFRNNENVLLKEGMWHVVPKGAIHCPKSDADSYVVMIEPEDLKSEKM